MMCQMQVVLCPLISVLMTLTPFLKGKQMCKASDTFLWSHALLDQSAIRTLAADTKAKKRWNDVQDKKGKITGKDKGNYLEVIKSTEWGEGEVFFSLSLIHWLLTLMRFVGGLCHTRSDMHRTW